jgi:hypothetical protein
MRTASIWAIGTLTILVAVSSSGAIDSTDKGTAIIAAAKAATGGKAWDQIGIWHEAGRAVWPSGKSSRYEHWVDLHSLDVRNVRDDGDEMHYMIFDGDAAYESANPRFEGKTPIDSRVVKSGLYMSSFGFFFPSRFPASFHLEGTKSERGVSYDVVKVSLRDLDPF